jgi:hypothetical protein
MWNRATRSVHRAFALPIALAILAYLGTAPAAFSAEQDGLLHHKGRTLFPIGLYELPAEEGDLRQLAASGVNLVRCGSIKDLDRAQVAGLAGWASLALDEGPTDTLLQRIREFGEHPALAVWEGPDEVVWNFTAFSGLKETAGFTREDWWNQTAKARAYANHQAARIIPNLRGAISLVREQDRQGRPIWINEAAESDVGFVREYVRGVDITGCDYYPIKANRRDLSTIGRLTDRWTMVGRGKPVWMVLQAFSWHRVDPKRHDMPAYPSFSESRTMAYSAIAPGARGIFYWGSETIDQPAFRASILAVTAELAALQAFLAAPNIDLPPVRLIEAGLDGTTEKRGNGVHAAVRRSGDDWLVVLVNEDDTRHLGVELAELDVIDSRKLHLLYGDETVTVTNGTITTRLMAYETKVFATSREWETKQRAGRDFE